MKFPFLSCDQGDPSSAQAPKGAPHLGTRHFFLLCVSHLTPPPIEIPNLKSSFVTEPLCVLKKGFSFYDVVFTKKLPSLQTHAGLGRHTALFRKACQMATTCKHSAPLRSKCVGTHVCCVHSQRCHSKCGWTIKQWLLQKRMMT